MVTKKRLEEKKATKAAEIVNTLLDRIPKKFLEDKDLKFNIDCMSADNKIEPEFTTIDMILGDSIPARAQISPEKAYFIGADSKCDYDEKFYCPVREPDDYSQIEDVHRQQICPYTTKCNAIKEFVSKYNSKYSKE